MDDEDAILYFKLGLSGPNPTNSGTGITYAVPFKTKVAMKVYDIRGMVVCELVNEEHLPGMYQIMWNGRSDGGRQVASGIYLLTMASQTFHQTVKIVLVR